MGSSTGPQTGGSPVVEDTIERVLEHGDTATDQVFVVGEELVSAQGKFLKRLDKLADEVAYRRSDLGGKQGNFAQRNPVLVRNLSVGALVALFEVGGIALGEEEIGYLNALYDAAMPIVPLIGALFAALSAQTKTTPVGSDPRR